MKSDARHGTEVLINARNEHLLKKQPVHSQRHSNIRCSALYVRFVCAIGVFTCAWPTQGKAFAIEGWGYSDPVIHEVRRRIGQEISGINPVVSAKQQDLQKAIEQVREDLSKV